MPMRSGRDAGASNRHAAIGPETISLVLRTGGSSSIPAFVRILEEIFDPSVIQERPVYTTVVHGLARMHWGSGNEPRRRTPPYTHQ